MECHGKQGCRAVESHWLLYSLRQRLEKLPCRCHAELRTMEGWSWNAMDAAGLGGSAGMPYRSKLATDDVCFLKVLSKNTLEVD